ncbi:PREDICTED: uncharacterized protein LOC105546210 [Mandrillus leucophaeus]|uniref:uncharacterized protein LOC105546210 n=1 Tax=Mandrillus leucophaeus TaxID=9568 RepID=UPI0005F4B772|nr:PREDICTED: uncharacterized protein LOC105546210 [Mandrillus leucophaeus]
MPTAAPRGLPLPFREAPDPLHPARAVGRARLRSEARAAAWAASQCQCSAAPEAGSPRSPTAARAASPLSERSGIGGWCRAGGYGWHATAGVPLPTASDLIWHPGLTAWHPATGLGSLVSLAFSRDLVFLCVSFRSKKHGARVAGAAAAGDPRAHLRRTYPPSALPRIVVHS